MQIKDYFHKIENIISGCPAILSETVQFDQRTQYIGFVKGNFIFTDGSELHFKEFIDTEFEINKYKYAYHYQKQNRLIFRYDNHLNYKHKHYMKEQNTMSSIAPNLEEVLQEIISLLA